MNELRKVMFRIDSGGKEGQETSKILLKKYKKYKNKLIKNGEKIISEKKGTSRFGDVIIFKIK